jgi:hypothetical protein
MALQKWESPSFRGGEDVKSAPRAQLADGLVEQLSEENIPRQHQPCEQQEHSS